MKFKVLTRRTILCFFVSRWWMKNRSKSSSEMSLDVERGREKRRTSPLPLPLPLSSTLGLPSLSASLFEFSQFPACFELLILIYFRNSSNFPSIFGTFCRLLLCLLEEGTVPALALAVPTAKSLERPMPGPAVITAGIRRAGIAVLPDMAVGIHLCRHLMFIRRFNPLLARSSRPSRLLWKKIGGFDLNLILIG